MSTKDLNSLKKASDALEKKLLNPQTQEDAWLNSDEKQFRKNLLDVISELKKEQILLKNRVASLEELVGIVDVLISNDDVMRDKFLAARKEYLSSMDLILVNTGKSILHGDLVTFSVSAKKGEKEIPDLTVSDLKISIDNSITLPFGIQENLFKCKVNESLEFLSDLAEDIGTDLKKGDSIKFTITIKEAIRKKQLQELVDGKSDQP